MSPALAQTVRSAPRTRLPLCIAAVAASLTLCAPAAAQTADARGLQNPRAQSAYAAWRKLSQTEVDCIERALRTQRTNLWSMIQRGINPTDPAGAALRAACRASARAPAPERGSQALAASAEARQVAERAAAERMAADKTAAKAAAEKAAAERAAAAKAAADRAAAEKAAAEQAAAQQAAWDKAASEEAAAEQAAIAQATAERTAAEKAAADQAAAKQATANKTAADKQQVADQQAAKQAATEKAAAEKAAASKAAVELASADRVAAGPAKAEAERTALDIVKPRGETERPWQDAVTATAEAAFAHAATDWRLSFIGGLMAGATAFCFGGAVFLRLSRRKLPPIERHGAIAAAARANRDAHTDFDRLVMAVLAELKRREGKPPLQTAPQREQPADDAAMHWRPAKAAASLPSSSYL